MTLLAAGTLLSLSVISPISAAVDALLYVDLRMRAEGLDIQLALPALPPMAPVAATAPHGAPVSAW